MRRILAVPILAVALTACGGADEPSGPEVPDLSGTWSFSGSMTEPTTSVSCNSTGSVTFVQLGTSFRGNASQQGACTGPSGSVDNSLPFEIMGGQINGNQVTFSATPICQYTGTIKGSNRITGENTCTVQESGWSELTFRGTWQVSR